MEPSDDFLRYPYPSHRVLSDRGSTGPPRMRQLPVRQLQLLAVRVHGVQVRWLHLRQFGFGQLRLHALSTTTSVEYAVTRIRQLQT